MDSKLFVGFNRQTVTPDESIPLTGFSNEAQRFHTSIAQEICATCIAITDSDDTTVLMVGMDICTVPPYFHEVGRQMVADAVGVPQEHIYMAATHTHAAPGIGKADQFPEAKRFREKFLNAIITACREALADRKSASMRRGSIEADGMNFVKHYKARYKLSHEKNGQICYIGDNFGDSVNTVLVDHATKADPTLHIVQFQREGGKDVVIANFRAHPHFDGGAKKYVLSSDFPGAFRKALETMTDCHAVYFQGASGNINSGSRMPTERRFTSAVSYGLALAGYAAECLQRHMFPAQVGKIQTKQITYYGKINHTMDHLAQPAKEIRHVWDTTFDRERCAKMSEPYGIRSVYHAGAIYWNSLRNDQEDGWMILNAVSIGKDFAFVTFPGEMFDSVSARMEDNSPFPMTMMLGYCYHHIGYLPSAAAFKYTSYETDITRFAPGTGESVADAQVEMLRQLYD